MSNRLTLTGDAAGECQWAEARRGVIRFGRSVRGGSLSKPLQDREIATFSVTDLATMLDMARASRREVERSLDAALEYHKAQVADIEGRRRETASMRLLDLPGMYWCGRCTLHHYTDSRIGRKHRTEESDDA